MRRTNAVCRSNRKNGRAMPAPTLLIFVPTMPVGATIGRPSCRFCRKRPLSRLRRQLPLRRGAMGGGNVIGCDCLPCARGGGSDACGRAGGVVFFSGDLKLYRCVYCGCPTGSYRPSRKKRAGNARPYVIDFCSDYARRGDHWSPVVQVLPEATPQSRQAVTAPLTQGRQGQYYSCTNRETMTANSARVAPPRGSSRPPGLPVMMPFTFAQRMAGTA